MKREIRETVPPIYAALLQRSKRTLCFFIISFALFSVQCSKTSSRVPMSSPTFTKQGELTFLKPNGTPIKTIDIEIADTPEKREIGMMGRFTMEDNQGMLFIFEETQPLSFWMKNTPLPLDMIFVDAANTIITIHKNTIPYSESPYIAERSGLYVIEVNAGFTDKYDIVEGDRINWKKL